MRQAGRREAIINVVPPPSLQAATCQLWLLPLPLQAPGSLSHRGLMFRDVGKCLALPPPSGSIW